MQRVQHAMRWLRAITLIIGVVAFAAATARAAETTMPPPIAWEGVTTDFHGYVSHNFRFDGCSARVVEPKAALPGRPWVWRMMFWDAFPAVDIALLDRGYHVAFMDVGNSFGCPDAMKHFDAFYQQLTANYGFSAHPALEGLSRGGLYAYRWAYVNADKVGCIYGDAPVCDMKSWPGGKGKGKGSPVDWRGAIDSYHFASEQEMMDFKGNPIDILGPIAVARIPIIHVVGDSDSLVPASENSDIVAQRYRELGMKITVIVKRGCDHHPHGLTDPSAVVNFIVAKTAGGEAAVAAKRLAPHDGETIELAREQWAAR